MIQRAEQDEGVAAIRVHLQGEDGLRARRRGQQVAHHREAQRHIARGQSLGLQCRDTHRAAGQANAAGAIGTKVDGCMERTHAPHRHAVHRIAVADAGRQFVLVHLVADPRLLAELASLGHVVLDIDGEATAGQSASQRIAVAVGGGDQQREIDAQAR
ncbi:hypothetical protein D9M68_781580 [compost metagenome]